MRFLQNHASFLRRSARLGVFAAGVAWLFGCGDDTPTSLGRRLRVPPDSLHSLELHAVTIDSVFALPISLGRSPVAQIGQQLAYTSHVVYDFKVPTRVVRPPDTLRLDTARILIKTDSLVKAPFTGSMRLGLREVALNGRFWASDSALDSVIPSPPLQPGLVARDTILAGASLANRALSLAFDLQLAQIAGYDSVRNVGGTLDVNVALLFEGFTVPGEGFLEYTHVNDARVQRAQFLGFDAGEVDAITDVRASRQRTFVDFDSTYSPGPKLVVSDGYRMHTFLKFASLRTVLPDSALVFRAELVLTQVDSTDGTSFGSGPEFGIVVPRDSNDVFTKKENELPLSFKTSLEAIPGNQSVLTVTPYLFDQQEGNVPNRGMLLRLTNEGTKARHFEFYGATAADSLEPRLRIIYGFPAQFEGGER